MKTYVIIDITLSKINERFEITNIRPLKDLFFLSIKCVLEVQKNLHNVLCDTFEALCSLYTQINKNTLLTEERIL